MLKKYLLSFLLLAVLVSSNFIPVFASIPSAKKHVRFSKIINIVKADQPSSTIKKASQDNSRGKEKYENATSTTLSLKN